MIEIEMFDKQKGKTMYVMSHSLEAIYFGVDKRFHLETRTYIDDTKIINRFAFDKLPDLNIPAAMIKKAKKGLVLVPPGMNIELPLMGGVVSYHSSTYEIINPEVKE